MPVNVIYNFLTINKTNIDGIRAKISRGIKTKIIRSLVVQIYFSRKFRVPKNSGQHRSSFCFVRRDATRFSFIVKKKDLPNAERQRD